jgi:type I restriction enzyme M protein
LCQASRADALGEFVVCFRAENRRERTLTWSGENENERWRAFRYLELAAEDKANLDISWLRDESLEDTGNLPDPDAPASEIVEDLQAALEKFREIGEGLAG